MCKEKKHIISSWGLVLFTLLIYQTPKTMSSGFCDPSHCGVITNITYPFRLPTDNPSCGRQEFELHCEKDVTMLHLHSGTYQVLGINYTNYRIRLRDSGIREGDCSSLPSHLLSRSNFTDNNGTIDFNSDHPYHASMGPESVTEITFEHVIYLECRDPVRDDAAYVDTAPCVSWGSKGGGHVYAVIGGDIEAGRLKPGCGVKSVAAIDSEWRSILKGKEKNYYSYHEIHRVISLGFELSWWPLACSDLRCSNDNTCSFNSHTREFYCPTNIASFCYSVEVFPLSLLCAYLAGVVAGMPSSKHIHHAADMYQMIDSAIIYIYDDPMMTKLRAFDLGKITGFYVLPPVIIRFLAGTMFLFILMIYTYRRSYLSVYESIEDFIRLHNLHPIRYSYKDLKTMTKGFKDNIGEGGFGTVYKGKLRSGSDVAVKMLGKSKATGQEFINEVATIGRIHHFNVVRLVGFCVEGNKRALIYEFMANGSLDKHIFSKDLHASLSYRDIYKISLGVARGITYLHHGCDMQILHFDIKPHNILLDDKMTPKISDFGLARLYQPDDSIATLTAARGTIGYMAPELYYNNIGKVSHKADVYSFGKLLMEMASGRRNTNPHAEHSSQVYFPSWIYDQFQEKKDIEMDNLTEEEKALAKRMFIVALWCIQFNPTDRPSMNKVIEMLEVDDVESLEMPPKLSIYPDDNDGSNFDQSTSSFSICSHGNLCEDARDKK